MSNVVDTLATRNQTALELLRFKVLKELTESSNHQWVIRLKDVNEVFLVARMPLIVPDEMNAKEINVIKFDKESQDDNTDDII